MNLSKALNELNPLQWEIDKKYKVVRLHNYGYKYLASGSDRDVYQTPINGLLLKTATGPQEKIFDKEWQHLYLPYKEFKLLHPVRAGTDEDIEKRTTRVHTWGQLQEQCELPEIYNMYLDDPELDSFIYEANMNKLFIQALIDYYNYSTDEIIRFIRNYQQIGGAISSRNWGYFNNKPVIFDYGNILEKRD